LDEWIGQTHEHHIIDPCTAFLSI